MRILCVLAVVSKPLSVRISQTTLRLSVLLQGLIGQRTAIKLVVVAYHSEGVQIKISKGKKANRGEVRRNQVEVSRYSLQMELDGCI